MHLSAVVPLVLGGYLIGLLLALFRVRLYSGAPVRGSVQPCAGRRAPRLWWTGIPGFLLARGRCPAGDRLPPPYWYAPALGATAGGVIAWSAVDIRHLLLAALFSSLLLALTVTDFERRLLPNRIMYPSLGLAVALSWAWPGRSVVDSLSGGFVGFVIMCIMFQLSPQLGFGDVKLTALLGLVSGLTNLLPALIVGSVAGGIVAISLLLVRRSGIHATLAYGPYLALGAFFGLLSR